LKFNTYRSQSKNYSVIFELLKCVIYWKVSNEDVSYLEINLIRIYITYKSTVA